MTLDLANFYLITLMKDCEYMQIKLADIPHEIIDEYTLPLLLSYFLPYTIMLFSNIGANVFLPTIL